MDKEFIISEIKRLAAENGGTPPGRQRFEKETGLRSSEVLGRYWARWSDAVREAGFAPNELQARFSDDAVLPGLAAMVRELGSLPTSNELRLRRRTDRSAPGHTYFPNKHVMIDRLAGYCRSHPGFEDVLAICAGYGAPVKAVRVADAPIVGEVYLIKSRSHYKIGRSVSAGRRTRELQIQLPERATRVHTIQTDDPVGIERYWHERFAAKRGNGEWFKLDAEDVRAFRRRKFM